MQDGVIGNKDTGFHPGFLKILYLTDRRQPYVVFIGGKW